MCTKDGAFADYFLAPAKNAFRVPESVTWEEAAAVDPLACAIHALNLVPRETSESIAIFGAGPSGLCFLQLCRLRNASKIIVIDKVESRLALAAILGADSTVNADDVDSAARVRQLAGGLGVHLAIEASGAPEAIRQCIKATRNKGKIIVYGVYPGTVDGVDFQDQHRREITIYGSSGAPDSFPTAIKFIRSRRVDVQSFISHRMRLDELPRFFVDAERRRNCLKAVVILHGEEPAKAG
jgi:L-iditol 2-dehydrogenase